MSTGTIDPPTPQEAGAHLVHEVVGPPLSGLEAGVAIGLGVVSLILAGAMPLLLGALADEHRLAVARIGDTAMLEALTMGLAAGFSGAVIRPARLRLIGLVAGLAVAAIDVAMIKTSGLGVMALRALAGLPEGVLLWITIGMIARTETPERWAGVFFAASTLTQFAVAAALSELVIPSLHANGAFVFGGLLVLVCAPVALLGRDRYAALPGGGDLAGTPPGRGWVALGGTVLFAAAGGAVAVYIAPLAHQAGLGPQVAGRAITASLAVQVLGSALATVAAGRVHYFTIFLGSTLVTLACWAVYLFWPPAWLFIAAAMVTGFVGLLATPFLVPMTIEADPSRRAAVQSGGAQLFGGALGPFLASRVVGERDVHGALVLGAVLAISALATFGGLHLTARKS
ncbi:MAG: hypothetical protein P4L73_14555 [Caulobacteraceae bacterium]|nr:hypothetical protein [Caulobacteraceae bacterium]